MTSTPSFARSASSSASDDRASPLRGRALFAALPERGVSALRVTIPDVPWIGAADRPFRAHLSSVGPRRTNCEAAHKHKVRTAHISPEETAGGIATSHEYRAFIRDTGMPISLPYPAASHLVAASIAARAGRHTAGGPAGAPILFMSV
jgi:hypothetical protein